MNNPDAQRCKDRLDRVKYIPYHPKSKDLFIGAITENPRYIKYHIFGWRGEW